MKSVPERAYYICEYCTAFYFPEENRDGVRSLDEITQIGCPVCDAFLKTGMVDDYHIYFCGNCQGILVNQTVFFMLVQYLRPEVIGPDARLEPYNPKDLERKLNCPYCGVEMDTHPYAGPGNITIDLCPACQIIWLDYGELYKIINAPGRDRQSWG